MKKLLTVLFAAFILLGMTACDGGRTYAADGEYTAFEIHLHRGSPMVTSVTVTIEDDEITGYYIDALQSEVTTNEAEEETGFAWNEETKKELGDDYGMVQYGGATAEWYEQAELIEAYWLENGIDAMETNSETYITNISGVTIKDGMYAELAQEAVQQAKDGVLKAYTVSEHYNGTANVTWATLTVDEEGNPESLVLDTLQSTLDTSGDSLALVWNEESKQEKGDDYGMASKNGNENGGTYEWFEQANMITDYILANGWEDGFTVEGSDIDTESDVTISTGDYEEVLEAVFNKLG